MKNIVEVSGLKKNYGDFSLQDVGFTLPADCITGFIGVNGAGKTTTIRLLLGLAAPEAGEIRFFGEDMRREGQKLRDRIGIVLDDGCLYDDLRMNEMKSVIAPTYSRWNEQEFQRNMERFSLHGKQKIATLSKGMRTKFALALALSHEAELLIMDEPTSGLDPLIRAQLMEILLDYMKPGGRSVFFSTHILSDLDKVADMVVLIDQGRILLEEDKDSLLEGHRIVKGDGRELPRQLESCFLYREDTPYGFRGLTRAAEAFRENLGSLIEEKPTLEDVMLGYIEGGKY